ncbi:MAG TPA: GntR family transcriptional regulator [Rhizomicrobium sp.]|nr:GntR family transcriptional regulator [Rhizomicrobium sp.]
MSTNIVDKRAAERVPERTLSEQLFRRLSDAIVSGALAPGSKLSEPSLAQQYGVSRGPLREAINRLQERHLVTRTAHFGARVAELSVRTLEETFIVREALEGMAARQAARNCTAEDLAALHRAYARHVRVAKDGGEGPVWRSDDEDFHVLIVRASGNPMLLRLLTEDFYQLVRFYRSQLIHVRGRGTRTVAEHRRILEAIEDRDEELAELHMRRHIAAAREALSAALRRQNDNQEQTGISL